jgi:hypothetical protein
VKIAAQHYTICKKIENNFHVNFVVQSVYKYCAANITLINMKALRKDKVERVMLYNILLFHNYPIILIRQSQLFFYFLTKTDERVG